jgi:hypothetical protein
MLKLIDMWVLKQNTEYSVEDERKWVKILYSRMERNPQQNQVFIHTEEYEGYMSYNKPLWYTEELSHAYNTTKADTVQIDKIINSLATKPTSDKTDNPTEKSE